MIKLDKYTEMKYELVGMDLSMIDNVINIGALQLYCPWIHNDFNMQESFSRLIDINKSNFSNVVELIKYVKKLDDEGIEFYFNDLMEEFECVKTNLNLETEYYDNILSYINYADDIFNPNKDMVSFCDSYCSKDDNIFDKVQVNRSLIKMIREERNDKN